jgi:hypothetical protein
MGNATSKDILYDRLAATVPPVQQMGMQENHRYTDLGVKAFANEGERTQFIRTLSSQFLFPVAH